MAVRTSLLTITTLVRAGARAFLLRPAGEEPAPAAPAPWPMVLLVAAVFAAGLFPGWIHALLSAAAVALARGG